jgi:hypothetical protein
VYAAARRDPLGEDDVILLGDLNVDEKHLGGLARLPDVAWVVTGVPTTTRGTAAYDNILFHRRATVEFTGRAGVIDLMRAYNLTREQAIEVSDHLPVWAEFSIFENGQPQRMVQDAPATVR